MSELSSERQGPVFVGDHLALDFVNTQYGVGPRRCECLDDDRSVIDWLKRGGLVPEGVDTPPRGLVVLARKLRENARVLLSAARARKAADADVVNFVLRAGRPTRELAWDGGSRAFVLAERSAPSASRLLEPVADAIAKLVTSEEIADVRQCEGDDCTLLFHDATRSHRRRWCSMAVCGNRAKVAAFRSRQKA